MKWELVICSRTGNREFWARTGEHCCLRQSISNDLLMFSIIPPLQSCCRLETGHLKHDPVEAHFRSVCSPTTTPALLFLFIFYCHNKLPKLGLLAQACDPSYSRRQGRRPQNRFPGSVVNSVRSCFKEQGKRTGNVVYWCLSTIYEALGSVPHTTKKKKNPTKKPKEIKQTTKQKRTDKKLSRIVIKEKILAWPMILLSGGSKQHGAGILVRFGCLCHNMVEVCESSGWRQDMKTRLEDRLCPNHSLLWSHSWTEPACLNGAMDGQGNIWGQPFLLWKLQVYSTGKRIINAFVPFVSWGSSF